MAAPVDYYVAAIVDAIEQTADSGTRDDGACTLPLSSTLMHYSRQILLERQPILVNKKLVAEALDSLSQKGFLELWVDEYADTLLYIPDPQKLFDSMEKNDPFQRLYLLKDNGRSWLVGALENINRTESQGAVDTIPLAVDVPDIPEEEDTWSPLPIDRHDPNFIEAVLATEQALDVIEGDNGYAVTEPEERNAILTPARSVLQILKEGAPSRQQVISVLLVPMQFLAKKFSDGIIGVAAKKAGEALLAWLGLS